VVSVCCKPGGGRKREARIGQNVDSIEELVSSQENAPDTRITGICPKHQCTGSWNSN